MHGYSESGPVYTAMKDGSLAAAIYHMTDHQLSSSIVLALMELCVAKNSNNYSGIIMCVCVMMGGGREGEIIL
jgi:hypothetical protein